MIFKYDEENGFDVNKLFKNKQLSPTLDTGDSYAYTQSEVGSASIKAIAENTTCSAEQTIDLA
mgnify:CR=1 FL=1